MMKLNLGILNLMKDRNKEKDQKRSTKILQDMNAFLNHLKSVLNTSIHVLESEQYDDIFFLNNMKAEVTKMHRKVSLTLKKDEDARLKETSSS